MITRDGGRAAANSQVVLLQKDNGETVGRAFVTATRARVTVTVDWGDEDVIEHVGGFQVAVPKGGKS